MPGAIASASGSPRISLRPHPNAWPAAGLHEVTLPVGPTVKKRPSSSHVVSSAALGFAAASGAGEDAGAGASGVAPSTTTGCITSVMASNASIVRKAHAAAPAAHAH